MSEKKNKAKAKAQEKKPKPAAQAPKSKADGVKQKQKQKQPAKLNSMIPGSLKADLFGRADLRRMLEAASEEYFDHYSGFHDLPVLNLHTRFDLLCKHQGWQLQHQSKHLHRFLALALAKEVPGLIDYVFDSKFGSSYLSSFGSVPAHSGRCSASERFKALAISRNWSEGGKQYKECYEAFRVCFFSDCAANVRTNLGVSDVSIVLVFASAQAAGELPQANKHLGSPSSNSDISSSYALIRDRDTTPETGPLTSFQDLPDSQQADTLALQFDKLAIENKWNNGSKAYRNHRGKFFRERFEDEWSEIVYTEAGSDDEDDDSHHGVALGKAAQLAQWQNLCHELGIDPVPHSITQCKKELKEVHVNIIDLLEARHRNNTEGDGTATVRRFPSAQALARYTRAEDKIFSKSAAKRHGALKSLLVQVYRPPSKKQTV